MPKRSVNEPVELTNYEITANGTKGKVNQGGESELTLNFSLSGPCQPDDVSAIARLQKGGLVNIRLEVVQPTLEHGKKTATGDENLL